MEIKAISPAQKEKILSAINSMSFLQFQFNKSGNLSPILSFNKKGSLTYSKNLLKGILADRSIMVGFGNEFTTSDQSGDVRECDVNGGKNNGGVTLANRDINATSEIVVVVSDREGFFKNAAGEWVPASPSEKLAHELVTHAIPLASNGIDPASLQQENYVRTELNLEERPADSEHTN